MRKNSKKNEMGCSAEPVNMDLKDPQTNLYGKLFFYSLLPHLNYPDLLPVSIIYLCADRFDEKTRQLLQFGCLLKEQEENRYTFFRLSEGEFVIIMAKTRKSQAEDFLKKIADSADKLGIWGNLSFRTCISSYFTCEDRPEKIFRQMKKEF